MSQQHRKFFLKKIENSFEERQRKWKERKEEKLGYKKAVLHIDQVKECTFQPEILCPDNNPEYDRKFYDRQLEWYEGVLETVEINKEIMFQQNHRDPVTFVSPFVDREEIPESVYARTKLNRTNLNSLDFGTEQRHTYETYDSSNT